MHKKLCSISYFGFSGFFLLVFSRYSKQRTRYLIANNRANDIHPPSYRLLVNLMIVIFCFPASECFNSYFLYRSCRIIRSRIRYEDSKGLDRSAIRDQNSGELFNDYPYHIPSIDDVDVDSQLQDLQIKNEKSE